jgi:hypothetical protein
MEAVMKFHDINEQARHFLTACNALHLLQSQTK